MNIRSGRVAAFVLVALATLPLRAAFKVEEATIAQIQTAIQRKETTATEIVRLYLARIKAYNGPAAESPEGLLGPVRAIKNAKGLNAYLTLNLRPAARKALGFDDRKARSMTDAADADPRMPDALEVAAELDRKFAATGQLVGPLHGVVIAVKDQYDTFDMRTTSGADAPYANDRPPDDATFVQRLRAAGAIIIGKANMGEYAGGFQSSFGGVMTSAYDSERVPGGSSGGSAIAVAANLATVAIAEETGPSIRAPAQYANSVGISPTQELVSRDGMINIGINTRTGPIARTVEDAARVLSVIAGYDPKDELTAFSVGRTPKERYETFAAPGDLKGLRIGVIREYLDKSVYTKAELANIEIADRAIEDLRKLGATIVDPGAAGLFTDFIRRNNAMLSNATFAQANPALFPVGPDGKPYGDYIATFVDLAIDPSKAPKMTIRDFTGAQAVGEGKYGYELYLRQRGDANIRTLDDLVNKSKFYDSPYFPTKKTTLATAAKPLALDTAARMQRRFAIQQIILGVMAEQNLDALVAPTGLAPSRKLISPNEPNANGIGNYGMLTFVGQQGFPAITVPAGFVSQMYDREPDPASAEPTAGGPASARPAAAEGDGAPAVPTRLVGPVPVHLPAGIDFIGRPFSEPILLKIAAAYEKATHHRAPPANFGPL